MKFCVNHATEPCTSACAQCQKPVCKECVILAQQGSICSVECSLMFGHAAIRKQDERPAGRRRVVIAGILMIFFMLVFAFMLVVHFTAEKDERMQSIDLLGKLIHGIRGLLHIEAR